MDDASARCRSNGRFKAVKANRAVFGHSVSDDHQNESITKFANDRTCNGISSGMKDSDLLENLLAL